MRRFATLALSATLLGCAAAHPSTGTDDLPTQIAAFERLSRALCDRTVLCARPQSEPGWALEITDVVCASSFLDAIEPSIRNGEVVVDPAAVAACIDAFAALPCSSRGRSERDASAAFVEAARACTNLTTGDGHRHCGDEVCDWRDPCHLDATCTPHCAGVPEDDLGHACDEAHRCNPGHVCIESVCAVGCSAWDCVLRGEGDVCAGSVCATLPGPGEPCLAIDGILADCASDTRCDRARNLCVAVGDVGAACDPSAVNPCVTPLLVCDAATRNCVHSAGWPNSGDPLACPADEYWSGGQCYASSCEVVPLFVDPTGVPIAWLDSCPPGTICAVDRSGLLGSCVPMVSRGGACDATRHCEAGSTCMHGTCVAAPARPTPCTSNDECADALSCLDGHCEYSGSRSIDQTCSSSSDCAVGACTSGRCAYVPAGSACSGNEQCLNACDPMSRVCDDTTPLPVGASCASGREGRTCADNAFCRTTDVGLLCCPS